MRAGRMIRRMLPRSRRLPVVTAAVLLAVAGGGAAATTVLSAEPGSPVRAEARGLARSAPVRIVIPALGVDAEVRTLALRPGGGLERPPRATVAGWYPRGTSPGEPGSAVIVGHTAGYRGGPPIFARLHRLVPGDRITVVRADGTAARFVVDRVAPYSPVERGPGRAGEVSLRLVPAVLAGAGVPAVPAGAGVPARPGPPVQPVVFATYVN